MDHSGVDDDSNAQPPYNKRFCITKNGRTYSQSHSYKLRQAEREKEETKRRKEIEELEKRFQLHRELMGDLEKIRAENENSAVANFSSSHPDTLPPCSPISDPISENSESIIDHSELLEITNPVDDNVVEADINNISESESNSSDSLEDGEDVNSQAVLREDEGTIEEELSFKSVLRQHFTKLHGIFAKHAVSLEAQREILEYMRSLPSEVQEKLPIQGRSLRPPPIAFTRKIMPPGEFTYFGIENMLNYGGEVLFDVSSNEIQIACNVDGLPLTKSTAGKHFWPIQGSIGEYPVFLIAVYEGPGQPVCANEYLRDFVDEVKKLTLNGCKVRSRTYKFRLCCLICDSPATCFITGVKQHGGYFACRRCKTEGRMVPMLGVNIAGRIKTTMRYPDLDDHFRTHDEFVEFALSTPEPHQRSPVPATIHTRKCRVRDEVQSETHNIVHSDNAQCIEDAIFKNDETPCSSNNAKGEDSEICGQKHTTLKRKPGLPRKAQYHVHPTILTEIPHFDLVKDVVLDSMHIIGGLIKAMLDRWNGTSQTERSIHKLPGDKLKLISQRLLSARTYCCYEFQRDPDSLEHLSAWKMTQFWQFLLYLGVVVLHDVIPQPWLHHFHLLVVAMRFMNRRLPDIPHERRKAVRIIANHSRNLLRRFFLIGNELYGELFAIYNAHHIPHIADDYERFEVPLISLSAFRFENANRHIKHLITAPYQPLTQLQNKVSSLVHTKLYGRTEKNKVVYSVEEYYEQPKLYRLIVDATDTDENDDISTDQNNMNHFLHFERFCEMRFRSFKLRTDNDADCYAFVSDKPTDSFIKLKKILRDINTGEVFLVGIKLQESNHPLFSLHPDAMFDSTSAGIHLCKLLDEQKMYTFSISALKEKCFGLPLNLTNLPTESSQWVMTRYLH